MRAEEAQANEKKTRSLMLQVSKIMIKYVTSKNNRINQSINLVYRVPLLEIGLPKVAPQHPDFHLLHLVRASQEECCIRTIWNLDDY